jgi:hypothetical protein
MYMELKGKGQSPPQVVHALLFFIPVLTAGPVTLFWSVSPLLKRTNCHINHVNIIRSTCCISRRWDAADIKWFLAWVGSEVSCIKVRPHARLLRFHYFYTPGSFSSEVSTVSKLVVNGTGRLGLLFSDPLRLSRATGPPTYNTAYVLVLAITVSMCIAGEYQS